MQQRYNPYVQQLWYQEYGTLIPYMYTKIQLRHCMEIFAHSTEIDNIAAYALREQITATPNQTFFHHGESRVR